MPRRMLLATALITGLSTPVAAQVMGQDVSEASFVTGWQASNGDYMAGVLIRMAPGWKTYWREPGGYGIPPQFDWTGSSNVASVEVAFPRPDIFHAAGERTVGYKNVVVLPVRVTPHDPGTPVDVALNLFYGVCEEVCVPAEVDLSVQLTKTDGVNADLIRDAMAEAPISQTDAGIVSVTCAIDPADRGFDLSATIEFGRPVDGTPLAVFETPFEDIWIGPADVSTSGTALVLDARMENYAEGPLTLAREDIRVTLISRDQSIDIRGCPAG